MDREEFRETQVEVMSDLADEILPDVVEALASDDIEDELTTILREQFTDQLIDTGDFAFDTIRQAWEWFIGLMKPGIDQTEADADPEVVSGWLATAVVNGAEVATTEGDKMWLSRRDNKVRPFHVDADGQIVPWSEPFTVCGDTQMMFPGQPVGDMSCWINCRCVATLASRFVSAGDTDEFAHHDPQNNALEEDMADEEISPEQECSEWGGVWNPETGECEPAEPSADEGEDMASEEPTPFWAVLAPEGEWSGDGRRFEAGALSSRDLPLPLMWQKVSDDGHKGSVVVGNISEIDRDDNLIIGAGEFADTPEADEVIGLIAAKHLRGVSIDVDQAEMSVEDPDSDGVTFSRGRICGATIVAVPAFHEAVLQLGSRPDGEASQLIASIPVEEIEFKDYDTEQRKRMAENGTAMPDGSYPIADCEDLANAIQAIGRAKDPEATKAHIRKRKRALGCEDIEIPDTWADEDTEEFKRGPGWVTHPRPTARIHAYWTQPGEPGYAKIRWGTPGDFTRMARQLRKYLPPHLVNRTAAEWHHDALGYWPGELGKPGNPVRRKGRFAAEAVAFVASLETAERVVEASAFHDPELASATPVTVTDDGYVFGHLAAWGTCHVGVKGACVTPPNSAHDYAYFRTGAIRTTEGDIPVGQITMGTGHASLSADPAATLAHYDNTGTCVADVACGEDEYGIWVAGVLRPDVTAKQVAALRGSALSGDWRRIGGSMELVAALAVNVPGFPVPRFAMNQGVQTALVSAGEIDQPVEFVDAPHDIAAEVLRRLDNRTRIQSLAAEVKKARVATLVASIEGN